MIVVQLMMMMSQFFMMLMIVYPIVKHSGEVLLENLSNKSVIFLIHSSLQQEPRWRISSKNDTLEKPVYFIHQIF
jgi:hypothetical protein